MDDVVWLAANKYLLMDNYSGSGSGSTPMLLLLLLSHMSSDYMVTSTAGVELGARNGSNRPKNNEKKKLKAKKKKTNKKGTIEI